jgi:hypothetical protein
MAYYKPHSFPGKGPFVARQLIPGTGYLMVADRRTPLLLSVLVEGRPLEDHLAAVERRSPRAAPSWGRGRAAPAAGESRRQRAGGQAPWARLLCARIVARKAAASEEPPACSRGRPRVMSNRAPGWQPGWPRRSDLEPPMPEHQRGKRNQRMWVHENYCAVSSPSFQGRSL